MPHDKDHVLATVHKGGPAEVERAIAAAAEAWQDWHRMPWEERASVFLRAAELLAGPWRSTLVAATMLNQSKTAYQAEIDAACEVIDFWRFNVEFMLRIYEEQPVSSPGVWNRMEYRPLEGFVFAVTPFNFTAIGANLSIEPGADGQRRPLEAGLDRRLLVVLDDAAVRGGRPPARRDQPHLRERRRDRRSRARERAPRGRPLHGLDRGLPLDLEDRRRRTSTATATTRGSSARPAARTSSSRTRAQTWRRSPPRSCAARSSTRARSAPRPRASTCPQTSGRSCASGWSRRSATIKMGDVSDFGNFMGAVIDDKSFARQREAIERGARQNDAEVDRRRRHRRQRGLLRRAHRDRDRGPALPADERGVLRPDRDDLRLPGGRVGARRSSSSTTTAPYGLTGAIFSQDRERRSTRRRRRCATRPATSTSTTSRPARSSASSRSAARARRARTTRPARCGT